MTVDEKEEKPKYLRFSSTLPSDAETDVHQKLEKAVLESTPLLGSSYTAYTKTILDFPLAGDLFKDLNNLHEAVDKTQERWNNISTALKLLHTKNPEEAETLYDWILKIFNTIDARTPLEDAADALIQNFYLVGSFDGKSVRGRKDITLRMCSELHETCSYAKSILNTLTRNDQILARNVDEHLGLRYVAAHNVANILQYYLLNRKNPEKTIDQVTDFLSAMLHPLVTKREYTLFLREMNIDDIATYWQTLDQIASSPLALVAIPFFADGVAEKSGQGKPFKDAVAEAMHKLVEHYKKHLPQRASSTSVQAHPQPL